MIRLIGIDVDGTLVGSSGEVHPLVWAAVEQTRARGIHLVLCSGRPAFGLALQYARKLEADGWHIFQNGASILHLKDGASQSIPLPPGWVKTLIARARVNGEALELYADDRYVTESTTPWARKHAQILGVPFEAKPFESLEGPVVRAQWLLSIQQAGQMHSTEHRGLEMAQSTSPLMPDTRFVGLTREGVSKGSAVRSVAAEYGVGLEDVMYVGDAGNDLSAMAAVGHPVAMGNAAAEVIKAARQTVGHVDSGGLAEALRLAIGTGS